MFLHDLLRRRSLSPGQDLLPLQLLSAVSGSSNNANACAQLASHAARLLGYMRPAGQVGMPWRGCAAPLATYMGDSLRVTTLHRHPRNGSLLTAMPDYVQVMGSMLLSGSKIATLRLSRVVGLDCRTPRTFGTNSGLCRCSIRTVNSGLFYSILLTTLPVLGPISAT